MHSTPGYHYHDHEQHNTRIFHSLPRCPNLSFCRLFYAPHFGQPGIASNLSTYRHIASLQGMETSWNLKRMMMCMCNGSAHFVPMLMRSMAKKTRKKTTINHFARMFLVCFWRRVFLVYAPQVPYAPCLCSTHGSVCVCLCEHNIATLSHIFVSFESRVRSRSYTTYIQFERGFQLQTTHANSKHVTKSIRHDNIVHGYMNGSIYIFVDFEYGTHN